MFLRAAFLLVSSILLQLPCNALGYKALIRCEDGFLTAGTGGRLDWISISGNLTKSVTIPEAEFNCLLSNNRSIIAAGDSGVVYCSTNNEAFKQIESGTHLNILALAQFNEKILAGAEQGVLLIGDEKGPFRSVQLSLKGNIVSLSARLSDCYGATDQGEIIHSTDGTHWTVFDFNAYYAGYYKSCCFTKILAMESQIAVAGERDDGSPVLMFSTEGSIWSERTLSYTDDQGLLTNLMEIPSDLFYDASEDQLLLVTNRGILMKIPSCSHCNKLLVLTTENLKGIAGNGNTWMVVGSNFYLKAMDAF